MRRRSFVRIGGLIGIGILAGCSGNNNENNNGNSGSSTTGTPTEEPGAEGGSDPTATEGDGTGTEESNTTTTDGSNGDAPEKYEEDESQAEQTLEGYWDDTYEGWIEFKELGEQLPQENYTLEEFPELAILEERFDAYSEEHEAVYLAWLELEDGLSLQAHVIEDDSYTKPMSDESHGYIDGDADVEGVLTEVVEGYNDVSPEIDEEYAEVLGVS
ncbi:hypothetical protein U3A55_02550 [Salarchaeum sp. III]|uniref:hypothetical protein n=1 Tax=Salarchaeum sp. III TaxID=3107927 RepID=UPI002EDAC7CE